MKTTTCNLSLARLTLIEYPDCENRTYKDCLVEYENKLKQSNLDKQALLEGINE